MEYEEKIAKLLGLELIDNGNYYELQSPMGELVGTIIKHEEMVNNHQEIYFITKIKTANFGFYRKRNINERDFHYNFYVDLDKDNRIFMEMDMGIEPSLIIYGRNTNLIKFAINNQELLLEYPTISKKGKALETLKIQLDNESSIKKFFGNYYEYQVVTSNNHNKTKKYKLTITPDTEEKIVVIQNTKNDDISSVKGTVREVLLKDSNAKDLFSRFRAYVNNLLPFKKDFLETFLEKRGINDDVFSILYPDLIKDKYYNYIIEINNNILMGVKLSPLEEPLKSYATIIYDLKDKYDFGYVSGYGDYAGFYTWNSDYIYRLSSSGQIEAIFDIKDRKVINDKEECQRLYDEYKNQKIKKIK